jgi:hypothetical protein
MKNCGDCNSKRASEDKNGHSSILIMVNLQKIYPFLSHPLLTLDYKKNNEKRNSEMP